MLIKIVKIYLKLTEQFSGETKWLIHTYQKIKGEEKGYNSNSSFTTAASPSIDLRKSVAPCASYTFSIAISDIIVVSPSASLVGALVK
ncbi:hypothetical protein [Bacillus thuringiensis]|uniref:hypothetical protein n=1 Tax=Bacillus thuringiensis TaxID=1428 RepID=UPI0001A1FB27|nr:hypothetical protein [Bacillus thuringiensis]EEM80214.1 hypothetical protein bthur0011_58380 [Bacillus thuringiensis serovar huazhongensis BGSC 4BD1]